MIMAQKLYLGRKCVTVGSGQNGKKTSQRVENTLGPFSIKGQKGCRIGGHKRAPPIFTPGATIFELQLILCLCSWYDNFLILEALFVNC